MRLELFAVRSGHLTCHTSHFANPRGHALERELAGGIAHHNRNPRVGLSHWPVSRETFPIILAQSHAYPMGHIRPAPQRRPTARLAGYELVCRNPGRPLEAKPRGWVTADLCSLHCSGVCGSQLTRAWRVGALASGCQRPAGSSHPGATPEGGRCRGGGPHLPKIPPCQTQSSRYNPGTTCPAPR